MKAVQPRRRQERQIQMKTLLLFLASAALHAAPITFTATGSVSPIVDGYYFDLLNVPGTANDRTAMFTASAPVESLSFYANNLPYGVGSGLMFYLDGVLALDTGFDVLVQQTLTLTAATPFTEVRLETHQAACCLERGTLTRFDARAANVVPEPATYKLVIGAFALCVVWGRVGFLVLRLMRRVDQGGDVNDGDGK